MSAPSSTQIKPESDADRAAKVVAGRTRSKSRATRAADKTQPASKPAASKTTKPAASKPAKSDELTDRDRQRIVMSALIESAGEARQFLAQRLQYTPSAATIWDKRLGPAPSKS